MVKENCDRTDICTAWLTLISFTRSTCLEEKEGCSHKVRRYCKGCYNKKLQSEIPKNKVTKVTTYTDSCKMNPYFCLDCFGKYHK
nr:unnamed protein product [Callosobruchus chinensis]